MTWSTTLSFVSGRELLLTLPLKPLLALLGAHPSLFRRLWEDLLLVVDLALLRLRWQTCLRLRSRSLLFRSPPSSLWLVSALVAWCSLAAARRPKFLPTFRSRPEMGGFFIALVAALWHFSPPVRRVRLSVRTRPSQGREAGSIPARATISFRPSRAGMAWPCGNTARRSGVQHSPDNGIPAAIPTIDPACWQCRFRRRILREPKGALGRSRLPTVLRVRCALRG